MGSTRKNKHKIFREIATKRGETILGHSYIMVKELPWNELQEVYKNHHRLIVFASIGCKCVNCDRVGTRLIIGRAKNDGLHVDVYTDDLIMMTVDHIVPRSRGGADHINNYQPMCEPCNSSKGNSMEGENVPSVISKKQANKNRMTEVNHFLKEINMARDVDAADKVLLGAMYKANVAVPPQEYFDQVTKNIVSLNKKICLILERFMPVVIDKLV